MEGRESIDEPPNIEQGVVAPVSGEVDLDDSDVGEGVGEDIEICNTETGLGQQIYIARLT